MPKMTHDEALAFIAATPARTAKVATVLDDGSPHVAPVWVALDGDDILFNTGATTRKGRSLSRDPRISMCFDDETPPFAFVVVTGTVTLTEDPDELLHWATLIGTWGPIAPRSTGVATACPASSWCASRCRRSSLSATLPSEPDRLPAVVGQAGTTVTGMPLSTALPERGSIWSSSVSTLEFTPAWSAATCMRVPATS
jgi:PPOX class probable F420-dependent enzyme